MGDNPKNAENNSFTYEICNNICPFCDCRINNIVKPISRTGVSAFLASIMINGNGTRYILSLLAQELINYSNIGRKIYCRPASALVEKTSYAPITIL